MNTSIVILSWNGRPYLPACLEAVLAQQPPAGEVIVVDNGSADGSPEVVADRWPGVRLIENGTNLGFAGGMNVGLRAARGDLLVILNQDTAVEPGWLATIRDAFAARPRLGIAGCKVLFPDGRLQHGGARLTYPLALSDHAGYGAAEDDIAFPEREVEYVTGAAMAMRRETLDAIGLLDELFYPAYFEDVDLCYRARAANWEVRYLPAARLVHHESTTVGKENFAAFLYFHRSRLRFVLKHYAPDQILQDFLPAERPRLIGVKPVERGALQRAYLEAVIGWSPLGIGSAAFDQIDAWRTVVDELLALRQPFALQGSLIPAEPSARVPAEFRPLSADALATHLETVRRTASLRELTFVSGTPLVGPLLVRLREAAASIASRWLVRALTQQQRAFNEAVAELLTRWSPNLTVADWAAGAAARRAQLEALEASRRFSTLERRLEVLEQQAKVPAGRASDASD